MNRIANTMRRLDRIESVIAASQALDDEIGGLIAEQTAGMTDDEKERWFVEITDGLLTN